MEELVGKMYTVWKSQTYTGNNYELRVHAIIGIT
eukprot:COSAG01_NODE_52003_length_350_cov_0.609562_1_plen_33_part_10